MCYHRFDRLILSNRVQFAICYCYAQGQGRTLRLPFMKWSRFVKARCCDLFGEALRRVDLEQLAGALTGWMQSHAGRLPRTLPIDGKIIRDKLRPIVTLVVTESGAPVAVMA